MFFSRLFHRFFFVAVFWLISPRGDGAEVEFSDSSGVVGYLESVSATPERQSHVGKLVEQLGASEFSVRRKAQWELQTMALLARASVLRAASSEDPEVRIRAEAILKKISREAPLVRLDSALQALVRQDQLRGDARTVRALFGVLSHCEATYLAPTAMKAMRHLVGSDQLDVLAQILEDDESDAFAIEVALVALGRADPDARRRDLLDPWLVIGKEAKSEQIRLSAAVALIDQKKRDAFPLLMDLLKSGDGDVRWRADHLLKEVTGYQSFFLPFSDEPLRKIAVLDREKWMKEHPDGLFANPLENLFPEESLVGFVVSTSDGRVVGLDLEGKLCWQLPIEAYDAQGLANGNLVITERGASQVRVIDRTGKTLRKAVGFNSPSDAEILPNGNFLVLDGGANLAVEMDTEGKKIREFPGLENPFDVDRLDSGHTLVADSGNNRLVEFDREGKPVWELPGLDFPNGVFRFRDGRTLYTTYTSGRIVMVDKAGDTIWKSEFEEATLYSPHVHRGQIHVADGVGKSILVLDLKGRLLKKIPTGAGFSDVGYLKRH